MEDPAAGRRAAHLEAGAHRPSRPAGTRSTLLPVTLVRVWQNPTTRAMCHTVRILSHSHGSIYFRLKSVIKKGYIFPYNKRDLNSKNYLVLSQRSSTIIYIITHESVGEGFLIKFYVLPSHVRSAEFTAEFTRLAFCNERYNYIMFSFFLYSCYFKL